MSRTILFLGILFGLTSHAQRITMYRNPILSGFYPDPSICRVENDYYLVTSSFAYYPGLPIFHSKDLVSWKQIGHAMDRPEQLDLDGAGVSRGLFAPTIRYYKGIYYIVCTLIDKGGNFVITAKNPKGPWSNPTWLTNVDGIDPSLYFDESTDKAWIIYNSIPPDNKPLHDGHRTIRMRSFDYKTLKAGDNETLLVNGGTDITKKPVWIEAPHIYKVNDWYYLLCAQGGTGFHHSEVAFRSKTVKGPYESFSGNPILTQWHLDANRKNPITTAGHADLVTGPDGKWYAVFLGCRPYEGDFYNTGRETFMAPVRWEDGWPIITKGDEEVKYFYPAPVVQNKKSGGTNPFSGNFIFDPGFSSLNKKIDQRFIYLRTVREQWYMPSNKPPFDLHIKVRAETVAGKGNPSFVGFRQSHLKCAVTASLHFDAQDENEKAGLIIFQNEHRYYYLCISKKDSQNIVQLYKSTDSEEMELVAYQPLESAKKTVHLRITSNGDSYSFYYLTDALAWDANAKWIAVKQGLDAKFLSTKSAGGFVGAVFGMYATSLGKPSTNMATYHRFEYLGQDDVYK